VADASVSTRPPVTANALKAGAVCRLRPDLRDGEGVPALLSPSSDVIIIVI